MHLRTCLPALLVLSLAPTAAAQMPAFDVIDVPGSRGTTAYAINDAGDVVGHYRDDRQFWRGFLLCAGQFTTIDVPGATQTTLFGVNTTGAVAGAFYDSTGKQHGFVMNHGTFTTIDFPGAAQTMVYGLNDRGDVTGMYFTIGDSLKHYGFVMIGGHFATLDHPSPNRMSCGTWIGDSGEVEGHVEQTSGAYYGYSWKDGTFTLIDLPGGPKGQFWDGAYGTNAEGDQLGTYSDAQGKQVGFLRRQGAVTMIMRGSGLPAGKRVKGLTQSVDVAPTVVDWLGIGVHPEMQGKSLLPLAKGEVDKLRDFAIAGYFRYSASIITEAWSFIHWLRPEEQKIVDQRFQLYRAGTLKTASHLTAKLMGETVSELQRRMKEAATLDGEEQWTCTPGSVAQVPERDQLFDRKADPFQLNNIAAKDPNRAKQLFDQLREFFARSSLLEKSVIEAEPSGEDLKLAQLVAANVVVEKEEGHRPVDGASIRLSLPTHAAILGSGGSGKEEFARLLARQVSPHSGTVLLGDKYSPQSTRSTQRNNFMAC